MSQLKEIEEKLLKTYGCYKEQIDFWFRYYTQYTISINKKSNAIECIYWIGRARTIAVILKSDFSIDTGMDREAMIKIKDYLQYEVLEAN